MDTGRARHPVLDRLRYAFDNFMARGTVALIAGLLGTSLLIVVVVAAAVALSGTLAQHDATSTLDFLQLVWIALMRTLDPGAVEGDIGTIPFIAAMLAVTIGGIFIFSALIGVISSGIEGRLADLRRGRSRVIESGHVVVIGWSHAIYSVLEQLIEANENRRRTCIVVLADRDKVEMDDDIRQRLSNLKSTKVVSRRGDPVDIDELDVASPQTARAIIVMSPETDDPDADVIKTLLALTNASTRRAEPYHIVAELRDPRNVDVARLAGRGEAQLVLGGELTGRITAQACRQPGLSLVYMDLLDFGGNEIYFAAEPRLIDVAFGDALSTFRAASLVGIAPRTGPPMLNPAMDRHIGVDDRLIFIAEDDDRIEHDPSPAVGPRVDRITARATGPAAPESTLVLGWNWRAPGTLLQLDRFVPAGSHLTVVARGPDVSASVEAAGRGMRNQVFGYRDQDTTDREVLENAAAEGYDHVVIMAYSDWLDEQRADARTLVTLLHLRDIAARTGRRFSIVSEMLDVRNRNLAKVTRADDFIVSDKLVSLAMSQLAENPTLLPVFDDLFDVEGSEIYLKPATYYVQPGDPVNFYTIVEAARRRGEVAFGYRLVGLADDPDRGFGVVLNPDKAAEVDFGEDDRIIVLARE